jgi:uracil-DNA glycosylase
MLETRFDKSWIAAIGEQKLLGLLQAVNVKVKDSRSKEEVLPIAGDPLMFKAFRSTPFDKVKVVWLGQDPYHDGSFNGLAFGNGRPGAPAKKLSPSLLNIQKELYRTHGSDYEMDLSLYAWAEQGVLLINTAHTVVKGEAGSHLEIWKDFTATMLTAVNEINDVVWVLLGTHAAKYAPFVTNKTHNIVECGHPSPLNRLHPFVGSDCFLKCDAAMDEPISWTLPPF